MNDHENEHTVALHTAIDDSKEDVVQRLIRAEGADVNKCFNRLGPLMRAAKKGNIAIVRTLLQANANVNASDERGCTALIHAIDGTNDDIVELLIANGADVNVSCKYFIIDGRTTLMYAAKKGKIAIIRALLQANANVNASDKYGNTALTCAIDNENKDIVELLIANGADVNVSCKYFIIEGRAPLTYAAKKGKPAIMRALLQAYTNYENKDIVEILIENGADVDEFYEYWGIDGCTPLMCATMKGNIAIMRALLQAQANVNSSDEYGNTALIFAIKKSDDHEELVELLIQNGADVNVSYKYKSINGRTPLMLSAMNTTYRCTASTSLLINAGANIHARDNEQETALFFAVRKGNTKAIEALVDAGADLNARNIYGRTPLFYSISWHCIDHKDCNFLLKNGARWKLKDNCGISILSYFISKLCCCSDDDEKSYVIDVPSYLHKRDYVLDFIKDVEQTENIFTSVINLLFSNLPKFSLRRGFMKNGIKFARQFASEHQKELVEKLVNLFADIAVERIPEMLDLLIELNADPESVDSYGNTALHSVVHLPCFGTSVELTMNIISTLEKHGARLDTRNHNGHSPLMHWLSEWEKGYDRGKSNDFNIKDTICKHFLLRGALVNQTGRNGETVFHLLLKLFHKILDDPNVEKINLKSMAELFKEIVYQLAITQTVTVNKIDENSRSPLHLWSSLPWKENIPGDFTFHCFMKEIFDHLHTCGIHLNARDKDDKTPLHCCKTWSAVKCLVEAGAKRNDIDSNGRTSLLAAAHDEVFEIRKGCFFPDSTHEPKSFFAECIKMGLDLWADDNDGESILSLLLSSGSFELAKGLVEAAACASESSILSQLLLTICKDEATHTFWKSSLVDVILSCEERPQVMDFDHALQSCCITIKTLYEAGELKFDKENEAEEPPLENMRRSPSNESSGDNRSSSSMSVHLDIVDKLRLHGANSECCKDLYADIKELKTFLTRKIDRNQARLRIPWTSYSQKHNDKLQRVARGQDVEITDTFWYYKDPIGSGTFGYVFAGINKKDGREIAIKKIEKLRMVRPEDRREITNLTALADCTQAVKYICFNEDKHFAYIVLELMEGHLDDYFVSSSFKPQFSIPLCRDLIMGVKYLHEHAILHRDLKPGNILYKVHPHLCLKIADFGLSSPLSTTGTTVWGSNAGTRCWTAPEVISSDNYQHTQESDNYSCGLLLHYVLSKQKHPFNPAHCSNLEKYELDTRTNMRDNKMVGLDSTLCPEATHLVRGLLSVQANERPSAANALSHPLFWTNNKKLDFLCAVGNQPEIERPLPTCGTLPPVVSDMETLFTTIVKHSTWDDARYPHMPGIYAEMTKPIVRGRAPPRPARKYNTGSVVELIRFIRNARSHVSEASRPEAIKEHILDAAFLQYFPDLVMEVYKIVIKHGWNTKKEINHAM